MPDRVTTSFIPKASLKTEVRRDPGRSPVGLISLLAVIVLVVAVAASIGTFGFHQYLIQSIASKKHSLDVARAAFEPATIKELLHLDTRLKTGRQLLSAHIGPSLIFDEIEKRTLEGVRFTNFSYGEASTGKVTVTMSGQAKSFNTLALQSDSFGESDLLADVLFSGLNIDSTGTVVFEFSSIVPVSAIAYHLPAQVTEVPGPDSTNQLQTTP